MTDRNAYARMACRFIATEQDKRPRFRKPKKE
jgi:hypothetical protein